MLDKPARVGALSLAVTYGSASSEMEYRAHREAMVRKNYQE